MKSVAAKLTKLFGQGSLITLTGRGNSQVAVFKCKGDSYFIKKYPEDSAFDRRSAEEKIYKIFNSHYKINQYVPSFIYGDPVIGFNVLEFLHGNSSTSINDNFLSYVDFLSEVINLPLNRVNLINAKEAVFNTDDLYNHINIRRSLLIKLNNPFVNSFIVNDFDSIFCKIKKNSTKLDGKFISPSDFGPHNSIITPNGIKFIDFEYGGFDTKFKFFSDIYWHVGFEDSTNIRLNLIKKFIRHDELDIFFQINKLMGFKWALLLLNEFFPEVYKKRILATGNNSNIDLIQFKQLNKAKSIIKQLEKYNID